MDVFELIATERRRTADMLAGLTAEQWTVRSLCSEWTVREMAGHLILPFSVTMPGLVLGVLKAGGSFSRFSVAASKRLGTRPTDELIETLRANAASRFRPPGHGPAAPLTDIAVHTRDIARPLGLDVSAPPEVWRVVLGFVTSPDARRGFVPPRRLAGLRLRATDQDWSYGEGPEVAGPSEALALAALGRTVAVDDVSGEGVRTLRERLR